MRGKGYNTAHAPRIFTVQHARAIHFLLVRLLPAGWFTLRSVSLSSFFVSHHELRLSQFKVGLFIHVLNRTRRPCPTRAHAFSSPRQPYTLAGPRNTTRPQGASRATRGNLLITNLRASAYACKRPTVCTGKHTGYILKIDAQEICKTHIHDVKLSTTPQGNN